MAVNPKIIMMVVDTLSTEKGRNTALKIVMVILGLIMMIFTVFAGIISGLLDVVETTDLQNHWQYIKSNLSDIFRGMETEIDDDVRAEVYNFMPDFSINLSKAAINSEFDGSSLILYDSEEIESAKAVMLQYAEELRSIGTESEFQQYIAAFDDTNISFQTSPMFISGRMPISIKSPNTKTELSVSSTPVPWKPCRNMNISMKKPLPRTSDHALFRR